MTACSHSLTAHAPARCKAGHPIPHGRLGPHQYTEPDPTPEPATALPALDPRIIDALARLHEGGTITRSEHALIEAARTRPLTGRPTELTRRPGVHRRPEAAA